jgi:hypothetical protein
LKDTTGGSMMDAVPQLVGESGFNEFFGKSRFFGGNLTVFEVQMASASLKLPEREIKIKLE